MYISTKFWPFTELLIHPLWTPVLMGSWLHIPQLENCKTKIFKAKEENIKQAIGIQVSFILEINLQKYSFWQNSTNFLAANMTFLNTC